MIIMNTKKIKKTRRLVIKNPKLRLARNNFRTIIKLAVLDEFQRIDSLDSLYLEKLRVRKKLTPTQFKRYNQLHEMKEYLITTFSNSICVCAGYRDIDADITGDRVRYSYISKFTKDGVDYYEIQEKWFSLQYYDTRSQRFESYLKKMSGYMKKRPAPLVTPLELHKLHLYD